MKPIAFYHQCGGCNQITEITPLNPWVKYYTMPIIMCNGIKCYRQYMHTVWLYEPVNNSTKQDTEQVWE